MADTASLSRLARDLRAASPAAWKACRASLGAAGQIVLRTGQANASWSTRIPASGRVRVTAGGNVKVIFGGQSAPDAAAIENKGKGFVRHPVFGNREAWTDKNSKPPFLGPAADTHQDEIAEMVGSAVFDAATRILKGGGV